MNFKESKDEIENVRVVVRVRPVESNNVKNIVTVDKKNHTITVIKPTATTTSSSNSNEPAKTYGFDNVFDSQSSQVSTNWFCYYTMLLVVAIGKLF